MKYYRKFISASITFFVLWSPALFAQFSVDAQFRNRFEIRDGYQKLSTEGSNPAMFISQRTRMTFGYETANLKLKFTPQDVRIWGDQSKMSTSGVGDNPSLDLLEAYAEVKLGKSAWISAGRQQLVYDSKRLLGNRNWNQNGKSYDALVFKLSPDKWNLHLGASWNTLTDTLAENPYPSSRIKSLNFLWLNYKFNNQLKLSLLHISAGITKTDTTNPMNFRHTTGLFGEYKENNFSAWSNLYYQYGKSQKGYNLSALLFDAVASYNFGTFTTGAGTGYLSGNKKTPGTQNTDHLFDPLYGNRHLYFGAMDYFTNYAKQTVSGGVADYYLWLDYRFSKKISLKNTAHYFALAQTNPQTPDDKKLGFENDLILNFRFSSWGNFEAGYCFFLPTESLKIIQNVSQDKFAQFFYLQLTLTPNLFSQKDSPEK
ncbi:MAG: alginate export family protein [Lentimicrobium sp.]|nr:alginate export family protein [Lentimicrobium sp.]